MTAGGPRALVLAWGNPARGDDGLGPALAAAVEALGLPDVTVECDYQLTVDHLPPIAGHDLVVFADADLSVAEGFRLSPVAADRFGALGSHSLTPATALGLAGLLYGRTPRAWTLGLAGSSFGRVEEGLSPTAEASLRAAADHLARWLPQALADSAGQTAPP